MRKHELTSTLGRVLGRPRTRLNVLHPLAPLNAVNPGQGLIESSSDAFASGGSTGLAELLQAPLKSAGEQVNQLGKQIADLKSVQQTHLETTAANTLALLQNTIAKASGGGSVAGTITSVASGLLGGGGLLSPILSGIFSLIGGGGAKAAPAPLVPFQLPAAIQYQGGLTANGQVSAVDYSQGGAPRVTPGNAAAPQVTIQVNAMDSRSFLDRSDDIAMAVRHAILHSSPLNDVIAEL